MPRPAAEKAPAGKTDPEVLQLLESKARAVIEESGREDLKDITAGEIHDMARALAEHAESMGEPLEEEVVEGDSFRERILAGLDARRKLRGSSNIVMDQQGVVGTAETSADVVKMAEQERSSDVA